MVFSSSSRRVARRRRYSHSLGHLPFLHRLHAEQLEARHVLATITVDTLVDESDGSIDDGDISLRDAVALAAAGDTVDFDAALDGGTVLLTLGELRITKSMTVDASMLPSGLTIDASGNDPTPDEDNGDGSRIFKIDDGDVDIDSPTTVQGMTLTGGDPYGKGGAVFSKESLTISSSTLSGNASVRRGEFKYGGAGGGIATLGRLTVNDSVISGNVAVDGGGAVTAYGDTTVVNSSITGNSTHGILGAGGIFASGAVAIFNSTISQNSARHGPGGVSGNDVTIADSTITGNYGGGITSTGSLTVIGSTITGNYGGGIYISGLFYNVRRTLSVNSSIVAGNTASHPSVDIDATRASELEVRFTLIGENTGTDLAEAPLGSPDENGNLIGDPNGMGIIDPLLAPLADNGGLTQTHRLLPGSPAINAGDPNYDGPSEFDQRGAPFGRVWDGRIDMGAYELHALTVDTLVDESDDDFSAGDFSLREAIETSNELDEVDVVYFDASLDGGTILLTHGELAITDSLMIDAGSLPNGLTIDASGNDPTPDEDNGDGSRVMTFDDGDSELDGLLTLVGIAITGADSFLQGGAIEASDSLVLEKTRVVKNSGGGAPFGIVHSASRVTVTNSIVSENSNHRHLVLGSGAAVSADIVAIEDTGISANLGAGVTGNYVSVLNSTISGNTGRGVAATYSVSVNNSTISNNTVARGGKYSPTAAGVVSGGTVRVTSSWITGNSGAGVFANETLTITYSEVSRNHGSGAVSLGTASILNSTISGNASTGNGGGICVYGATTIWGSTISENTAQGRGGGIYAATIVVIANSTITANVAERGGGVSMYSSISIPRSITVENSLIAGNAAEFTGSDLDSAGADRLIRYSLVGDRRGTGLLEAPIGSPDDNGNLIGDLNGVGVIDPMLSPLADNGGPTQTHRLLSGSPAINAGDPEFDGSLKFDQRGAPFSRVWDGRVDMGAYELHQRTVDTLDDESDDDFSAGDLSLREAIELSNGAEEIDVVYFDASLDGETILLTHGELAVTDSLTIDASSLSNGLTIDASGNDPTPDEDNGDGSRIFNFDDGDFSTESNVSLAGLVLMGGDVSGDGGGILSRENLNVFESTISSNAADRGGGISGESISVANSTISGNTGGGIAASGDVSVTNSTISGNVTGFGTGSGIAASGDVTVTDSTISGNVTGFGFRSAGGINASGDVTVTNSTISGNSVAGKYSSGGGIRAGRVTITNSKISGNTVNGRKGLGGGISATGVFVEGSVISENASSYAGGGVTADNVTIQNSTISGNTAGSMGGGIYARNAVTVTHSTISGNNASYYGGGISMRRTFGGYGYDDDLLTLDNSIVADNTASGRGPDIVALNTTELEVRFSLIGDNTGTDLAEAPLGFPDENGNLIGDPNGMGVIDPLLGPLAYNGGPTMTHALLPGSPAVNMGDPEFVLPPDYDQRGTPFVRVASGRIDMGAFEYQITPVDFVSDHVVACDDVKALGAAIVGGDNSTTYDLTGDAIVDRSDLDVWLTLAGINNLPSHTPYQPGDANLDGRVDAEDFGIWNDHRFTATAAWCAADFNADGVTDGDDFNIWNVNKFTSVIGESKPGDVNRLPGAPLDHSIIRAVVSPSQLNAVDSHFATSAKLSGRGENAAESSSNRVDKPIPHLDRVRSDAVFRRLGRSFESNDGSNHENVSQFGRLSANALLLSGLFDRHGPLRETR